MASHNRRPPPYSRAKKTAPPPTGIRGAFRTAAAIICKYARPLLTLFLIASLASTAVAAPLMHNASNPFEHKYEKVTSKQVVQEKTPLPDLSPGKMNTTIKVDNHLDGTSNESLGSVAFMGGGTGGGSAEVGEYAGLGMAVQMTALSTEHGNDLGNLLDAWHQSQANGTPDATPHLNAEKTAASSVGYITMLYGLSEKIKPGSTIYSEKLGSDFLSKERVVTGAIGLTDRDANPGMNLSVVKDGIQGGFGEAEALNMTKVVDALNTDDGHQYFAVATDRETLKPVLIPLKGKTPAELINLIDQVCGVYGVCGQPGTIVDADSSGYDSGLALIKTNGPSVLFSNGVKVGTPEGGIVDKLVGLFTVMCAAPYTKSVPELIEVVQTELRENARNAEEVRTAQEDPNVIVLGAPQGDQPASSAEMNPAVLKKTTVRSFFQTTSDFIRAKVASGKVTTTPNTTYEVHPFAGFEDVDQKLVIQTDENGHIASTDIVKTIEKEQTKTVKVKDPGHSKASSLKKSAPAKLEMAAIPPSGREARARAYNRSLMQTQSIRPDHHKTYAKQALKSNPGVRPR